jgi:hypothetical protein
VLDAQGIRLDVSIIERQHRLAEVSCYVTDEHQVGDDEFRTGAGDGHLASSPRLSAKQVTRVNTDEGAVCDLDRSFSGCTLGIKSATDSQAVGG